MANGAHLQEPRPHTDAPQPAGQSRTSPKAQKQGKVIPVQTFTISQIPDVMENKLGWRVAAKLQREWLQAAPAYTMTSDEKAGRIPPSQYAGGRSDLIDSTTVTMAWALHFERVRKAVDAIYSPGFFADPLYSTPKARAALIGRIKHAGLFATDPASIGDASKPALWQHEHWQFQRIDIDVKTQERILQVAHGVDELFGAAGGFNLYLVPMGRVTPKTTVVNTALACELRVQEYIEEVTDIGVYLRDTYDFNGAQYLGHWGKEGVEAINTYALRDVAGGLSDDDYRKPSGDAPDIKWPVGNVHDQRYRTQTQKGGDLLIFSDVQFRRLKRPFCFTVSPDDVRAAK